MARIVPVKSKGSFTLMTHACAENPSAPVSSVSKAVLIRVAALHADGSRSTLVTVSESPTPLLTGLTALEQQVIDAARRGDWVEPADYVPMEELKSTDDPGRQVRAALIRELLMGRRSDLDPRGVRIRRVRVVGQLDLDHVTTVTGLVLVECALGDGVTCAQAQLPNLSLSGSHLSRLDAENMRTDGNMDLNNVVVIGTAGEQGLMRLVRAHIGGDLYLHSATVTKSLLPLRFALNDGAALNADDLHIEGSVFLVNATVSGTGDLAAVRLLNAHIGGQLVLEHAKITNSSGPGLAADNLRTGGSMLLSGTTVAGASSRGAVRLDGAHIGGPLELNNTAVVNDTGPSLAANGVHADRGIFIWRDTTLRGTVQLTGARIAGPLHLNVDVVAKHGPLIRLSDTQVTGVLNMPASVVCPHAREKTGRDGCSRGDRIMWVQGLIFPALENVSWREWLHLLMHHTREYLPQPYQQLAAVERASGHDNNARQVLIAQQEDLRRRAPDALGGWIAWTRHWLWGRLGQYGYRAHRLFIALAIVLTLAAGLSYAAGQVPTRPGHHAAERVPLLTATTNTSGTPCSTAELIGVGIDRGLPLGATGLRARCDLDTGTRWGQAFTYVIWALQALVWALATLAIAAYTGLIRKPA